MYEERFRGLRSYFKELELEEKKLKEEKIKKHQRIKQGIIEVFSSKVEVICKGFAKGVEWKYRQWKVEDLKKYLKFDEEGLAWGCEIIKPGFSGGDRIRVSLWTSGRIHVFGEKALENLGGTWNSEPHRGITIPLDVDSGTFDENAFIQALEEEYKGIVRHELYLKRLFSNK